MVRSGAARAARGGRGLEPKLPAGGKRSGGCSVVSRFGRRCVASPPPRRHFPQRAAAVCAVVLQASGVEKQNLGKSCGRAVLGAGPLCRRSGRARRAALFVRGPRPGCQAPSGHGRVDCSRLCLAVGEVRASVGPRGGGRGRRLRLERAGAITAAISCGLGAERRPALSRRPARAARWERGRAGLRSAGRAETYLADFWLWESGEAERGSVSVDRPCWFCVNSFL